MRIKTDILDVWIYVQLNGQNWDLLFNQKSSNITFIPSHSL